MSSLTARLLERVTFPDHICRLRFIEAVVLTVLDKAHCQSAGKILCKGLPNWHSKLAISGR